MKRWLIASVTLMAIIGFNTVAAAGGCPCWDPLQLNDILKSVNRAAYEQVRCVTEEEKAEFSAELEFIKPVNDGSFPPRSFTIGLFANTSPGENSCEIAKDVNNIPEIEEDEAIQVIKEIELVNLSRRAAQVCQKLLIRACGGR